jgi:hypothetical protein
MLRQLRLHVRWSVPTRCKGTAGAAAGTIGWAISAQWISFAGFYQKKIIKEFCKSANQHSLTGFLAHGKPAVVCLEGNPDDIQEFLRHVRTTVLATVPRGSRKMRLGLREPAVDRAPRFESFQAKSFFSMGNHHRPDMLDRKQLDAFLKDHGVSEEVRKRVGGPVE